MKSRPETHVALVITVLCLAFTIISCSSGPAPPAKGSPEWSWSNAQETWDTGDLLKTADNLEAVAEAEGPLALQAQAWRLILTGGLAGGYMEMADAMERGSRANAGASADFRRQMNDYRSMTNRQVGQFYGTFMEFKKSSAPDAIPLTFSFPKGSAAAVAEIARINEGAALSGVEVSSAERRVLQRAVLLEAARAVGAEKDSAKAQQLFAGENPTVPKNTFLLAMAQRFHEMAGFYNAYKMDQPDRLKMFNEQALEILKSLPESDETKELIKTIEAELKAAAKR